MDANKYIRIKRLQLGISQKELARLSGFSESEISKIENGLRKVNINIIQRLMPIFKFNEEEMKNIFNINVDNLNLYNSYASNLDSIFTYEDVHLIESLGKLELIKLKNYIAFLSDKKISNEDKEAVNIIVKSLNKPFK